MRYQNHFSTRVTPQSEAIPGSKQVPNSAGGYAFAVDDWKRLERFLILGAEGGTYYIGQHKLVKENAEAVLRCIKADGRQVVNTVVEISEAGRAPKNDPALFALAMCAGLGDKRTRQRAFTALPKVARIGTHLFHFLDYVQAFRGWGRSLREGVADWYNRMPVEKLAYQVIKYRQRDGWSHRDALRLCHAKNAERNAIYGFVTQGKWEGDGLIGAYLEVQATEDVKTVVKAIVDHRLPREAIPTQFLKDPSVWEALLEKMPMTAMIRNLGNMSKVGLLKPLSDASKKVVAELGNEERLRKARVHPLKILAALSTYSEGRGFRGSGEWDVVPQVVDALDKAFYLSFGNVESTGQNVMLALDVSGSMTWSSIAGVGNITPRMGAAAMSLVTANVEPNYAVMAFAGDLRKIAISPRQRLDDVIRTTSRMPAGSTDCALPMLYALDRGLKVDLFCVYTDSETWFGQIHPIQALRKYREKMNPKAKLVVVGMVSNEFSIADPDDAGMLDVCGFDTATPMIIHDFATG